MEREEKLKRGNHISKVTLLLNALLSILKILAGFIGNSGAMIADGIHSISDIVSTVAVMFAINIAGKPRDENHPYGHEKLEPIITHLISAILFFTAVGIGYRGITTIISGTYEIPGRIAVYAAILSIVVKEGMYHYAVRGAKEIDSSALFADAWHHRSDVFTSLGTLAAILGARFGYRILDPLAALIISGFILKVALEIYLDAINRLVDHAGDEETIKKIKDCILKVELVKGINGVRSRKHGNRLYVDVKIAVDGELSVMKGHGVAEEVHDKIEEEIEKVKHCMVHVEPYFEEGEKT